MLMLQLWDMDRATHREPAFADVAPVARSAHEFAEHQGLPSHDCPERDTEPLDQQWIIDKRVVVNQHDE